MLCRGIESPGNRKFRGYEVRGLGSPGEGNGEVMTDKRNKLKCYLRIRSVVGRTRNFNRSFEILYREGELEDDNEDPNAAMRSTLLDTRVNAPPKLVVDAQSAEQQGGSEHPRSAVSRT